MSGANSGVGKLAELSVRDSGTVEVLRDQRDVATKLAAAAGKVQFADLPGYDPRTGYYASRSDGNGNVTHELVLCPVRPREHVAGDLKAIVDLAEHELAGLETKPGLPKGEGAASQKPLVSVWVSPDEVRVVFDHQDRREQTAALKLAKGEAFSVLQRIKDGLRVQGIDQPSQQEPIYWRAPKVMIDLIRIGLGAKQSGVVKFAPFEAVTGSRTLKISGTSMSTNENTAGRESISSEATAEAAGWKPDWEDVTVTLPVYEDVRLVGGGGCREVEVACDYSLNTAPIGGALRLRPKAGELARAVEAALLEVITDLRSEIEKRGLSGRVAVYRGAESGD